MDKYASTGLTANDPIFEFDNSQITLETAKIYDIFGIKFPSLDYETALAIFQRWIDSKAPHQVCFVNVHTLVNCLKDEQLQEICNQSLNTMDGVPLVWYSHLIYQAKKNTQVCGPDLMLKCLDKGRSNGWKHFFLGNTEYVLNDLADVMQKRYPGVEIVGWYSPPFRTLTNEEDQHLVDMINSSKPDFLWVSLGAPKQEKWIANHLHRINVPVQLGVGAAFSFHSGHVLRAPRLMQVYGLEWLFRMLKEPRLVKRYLSSNPIFLGLFIRDYILSRLFKNV
jgi:N-acetylglucosaminyldiphosphoundecaprenol N-acetyl-beta-D-mannosaminyltransferase